MHIFHAIQRFWMGGQEEMREKVSTRFRLLMISVASQD